eukprot:TRINITY_DN2174_c0_g1_i1.p1 TRINITY_DN2174_c0_g1~~TRINITY_DN2174_c0_g1_i1.p1  ORF type:complete len:435 (-),score=119.26 TRINITY_DN2174_c0_g1_i1:29-1294(-)
MALKLNRRVFLLGGHITPFIGKGHPDFIHKKHPEFGKRENPILEDYIKTAVNQALKDLSVPPQAIQKAWIGNFAGELFSNQGHLGSALAGVSPAFRHKPFIRVEAACASGGIALSSAVESIQAGTDVALVVGAEVQNTVTPRVGGDYLARAADYKRQRSLDDFTFPAMFARRIKEYMAAHNVTREDIARVSVKAYANANKNPLAHMREVKLDLQTASTVSEKNVNFLSNEELKAHLTVGDCSQVSDGAAAAIVVSEDGLKALNKSVSDAVEFVAVAQTTDNLFEDYASDLMENTKAAADAAYAYAKLRPTDMGVAEVHDCFSIAEVLMYEALGFAERGQGTKLLKAGHTNLDGPLPVNTGGGLIGFGHPVGATGIKQVLEIYRQMKGLCGEYQIPHKAKYGITANMGGNDKTSVVTILKNL